MTKKCRHKESKLDKRRMLAEILISYLGIFCIIETLFSGNPFHTGIILPAMTAVVLIPLFCFSIQGNRYSKFVLYVAAGFIMLLFIMNYGKFNDGIKYAALDMKTIFSGNHIEYMSERNHENYLEIASAENCAICFFVTVVSFVITVIVTFVPGMISAAVIIIPLFSVYIANCVIPFPAVFIGMTGFLFACSAKRCCRQKNYKSIYLIVVVSFMVGEIINFAGSGKENYKRPEIFISAGNLINYYFDNEEKNQDNSSIKEDDIQALETGEINNQSAQTISADESEKLYLTQGLENNTARLGMLDSVNPSDQKMGSCITNNIENTNYIPVTYYDFYEYGKNMWRHSQSNSEDKNNITLEMMRLIGNSNEIDPERVKNLDMKYLKMDGYSYGGYLYSNAESEYIKTQSKKQLDTDKLYDNNNLVTYKSKYCINYAMVNIPEECRISVDWTNSDEVYDYIDVVKNYLEKNCTYTLNPGAVPEGKDFLDYFINESHKGYCTYFATAATVMFQKAGIPARYVEGFSISPKEIRDGDDTVITDILVANAKNSLSGYVGILNYMKDVNAKNVDVKVKDAHAWTEVYINGFGWITVDATPSVSEAGIINQNDQDNLSETVGNSVDDLSSPDNNTFDENKEQPDMVSMLQDEKTDSSGINTENVKNIIRQFFLIIAAVFMAIFIGVIIGKEAVRWADARKKNQIRKSEDILEAYEYFEKNMKNTIYERPDNMDYEAYGKYLEENNEYFRNINICVIIDEVLKERFSGKQSDIRKEIKVKYIENLLNAVKGSVSLKSQ